MSGLQIARKLSKKERKTPTSIILNFVFNWFWQKEDECSNGKSRRILGENFYFPLEHPRETLQGWDGEEISEPVLWVPVNQTKSHWNRVAMGNRRNTNTERRGFLVLKWCFFTYHLKNTAWRVSWCQFCLCHWSELWP